MSENVTPDQTPPTANENENNAERAGGSETGSTNGGTRRPTRFNNRYGNITGTTHRDFAGDTPKIGGILGLRSENVTKKINYDLFCEKLGTYIMTEFKNGDAVFQITKEHSADVLAIFITNNKPNGLTDEEKQDSVNVEIHKEEIKEYVKELKILKSNLKKLYSLIYGNCTESVQTMLKVDDEYEEKSKVSITYGSWKKSR